ncbi:cytochrome P450 [Ephemerocybe angulata]|uniref:Cytochrome P450 n=1 Tax=Ephemerocybe angulata TaxID=980116 RepID=A0A8H6IAU3_9AGAR|nr:cytochrome P450 [Tulosesus angulatus]
MLSAFFRVFISLAVARVLWNVVRWLFKKDPLDNIPGPPSKSFLTGSMFELSNPRAWQFHHQIAEEFGGVVKFKGLLGENSLYVYDPKALQHIVVKDQPHIYEEGDLFLLGNKIIFGEGLFSTTGDLHRRQRKMLNPVFSIAHMRDMIPIFYNVVEKLGKALHKKVEEGPQTVEMHNWMTRTALELIGQSGLGYSFDPLTEGGTEHPYSISVKSFVDVSDKLKFSRFVILPFIAHIGTRRFQRAVVDFLSMFWKSLRSVRDIVDIMHNTSVDIFEEKKKALQQGDAALEGLTGKGKDIISILLKANMAASEEDRLPDAELLAQMSTLTFAAMDTTSNALARILHLLCDHQEAQDKLREEITEAQKQHGRLQYDELVSLPYLDAICRETMRLHPPVPMLLREAYQDAILPVSKPVIGVDGTKMDKVFVPKGTNIFISPIASNRNPELWGSDALEWKPERWLSPLPDAVIDAKIPGVYSHLMTFLGGGRACIGFKFSQLEMKVVLATLIPKFKFECENKNIFWSMNGIVHPTVDEGGALHTQLPLKVTYVGT